MRAILVTVLLGAAAVAAAAAAADRVLFETDVELRVPEQWARVSPAPRDHAITLHFALRLRNMEEMHRRAQAIADPFSSSYGQYMTLSEIHALTSPPLGVVQQVKHALLAAGIIDLDVSDGGFVRARTSVAAAERLLQVSFEMFEWSGVRIARALQHYSLPASLAAHVQVVGGVTGFPRIPRVFLSSEREEREVLASRTTPSSIQAMYNISVPANETTNFQAVASFLNQFYDPDDLTQFQKQNDLPLLPIERTVGPNKPGVPGTEASLDVQYLTGVTSDSIRTWVWSTSGKEGINEPFLDWLQDLDNTDPAPLLFSISYQDLEYTVSEDYADRCNDEFAKNTGRGITFITGSGDWGVGCESGHCSAFTADFPSSSPYVTSTGGTTLSGTAGEIGVGFSSGGFSNYFSQPSYQSAAISQWQQNSGLPSPSLYNISGKGFPDVAAIGTNFQVVRYGRTINVGGTSASTPTFGAMLSMINSLRIQKGMPVLGNVNPTLYAAWSSCPGCYQDITSNQPQEHGCCSVGFDCKVGWDPVTGLGTPNFGLLSAFFLDSSNFASLRDE